MKLTKKELFKDWLNSDNVIKLGNKYTFQCIQYKKQFTYKQSYKYWLKEYYYIQTNLNTTKAYTLTCIGFFCASK